MKKSLYELAMEYDESARSIEKIVTDVRVKIKQAKLRHDTDEIKRLSAKLLVLYEEIRDLRILSEKMKTYYDKSITLGEAV